MTPATGSMVKPATYQINARQVGVSTQFGPAVTARHSGTTQNLVQQRESNQSERSPF